MITNKGHEPIRPAERAVEACLVRLHHRRTDRAVIPASRNVTDDGLTVQPLDHDQRCRLRVSGQIHPSGKHKATLAQRLYTEARRRAIDAFDGLYGEDDVPPAEWLDFPSRVPPVPRL